MSRGFLYPILFLGIIAALAGTAELSLQSATCMACHRREAFFARWMGERLVAEKKGFSHELVACADCHISGSPAGTVMSRFRGLYHAVKYFVPQLDPRRTQISGLFERTRVPVENCQYCHLAAQYRKAVYLKDLPEGLKQIGLVMDHRKHVLAREDTCAKCHEQYKDRSAAADKEVNYAEVNHMSCDACHTRASHAYLSGQLLPMSEAQYVKAREDAWDRLSTNPRWMVAIPSEQTCRRCHNGEIHYKTRIFPADCREGKNMENCLKCHPLMTKEYFEQYLREREKPRSKIGGPASRGIYKEASPRITSLKANWYERPRHEVHRSGLRMGRFGGEMHLPSKLWRIAALFPPVSEAKPRSVDRSRDLSWFVVLENEHVSWYDCLQEH